MCFHLNLCHNIENNPNSCLFTWDWAKYISLEEKMSFATSFATKKCHLQLNSNYK